MKTCFLISLFLILLQLSFEEPFTKDVTCVSRSLRNNVNFAYSLDYCRSLDLNEYDLDGDVDYTYYRCCYATAKDSSGRTVRGCVPIDYDIFADNKKGFKDDAFAILELLHIDEDMSGFSKFKIHCSSNYLSISILLALIIILF